MQFLTSMSQQAHNPNVTIGISIKNIFTIRTNVDLGGTSQQTIVCRYSVYQKDRHNNSKKYRRKFFMSVLDFTKFDLVISQVIIHSNTITKLQIKVIRAFLKMNKRVIAYYYIAMKSIISVTYMFPKS